MSQAFAIPNSIRVGFRSRTLYVTGLSLAILGALCVLNAAWATALGGVKSFSIRGTFFNTHWISTVHIGTGLSIMVCESRKINFFLFQSIALVLVSICVSFGTLVADGLSIYTNVRYKNLFYLAPQIKQTISVSIGYCSIDVLTSAAIFTLSIVALGDVHASASRFFGTVGQRSYKLIVVALGLMCASSCKLGFYIYELCTVSSNFEIDKHTFDEPIWQLILIFTAICVLSVGQDGTRLLLYVSLILCFLSYYPVVQYIWMDHRLITIKALYEPHEIGDTLNLKSTQVLISTLSVNVLQLLFLATTTVLLVNKAAKHGISCITFSLDAANDLQKLLAVIPVFYLLFGVAFLASDAMHVQSGTFFRLLQPTEEKLPFIMIPIGLTSLLLLQPVNIRCLVYPFVFTLLLQCAQYCQFHMFAFIYLANGLYHLQDFCEYFSSQVCNLAVNLAGSIGHFFEAFMAAATFIFSLVFAFVIGRIMTTQCVPASDQATDAQKHDVASRRRGLLALSVMQLLGSAGALSSIVYFRHQIIDDKLGDQKPLMILHYVVNQACHQSQGLFVGAVQLAFVLMFRRYTIMNYPIVLISIVSMNAMHIIDILLSMDYTNVARNIALAEVIRTLYQLISLCVDFSSILQCGFIIDAATNQLPSFEFDEVVPEEPRDDSTWDKHFDIVDHLEE